MGIGGILGRFKYPSSLISGLAGSPSRELGLVFKPTGTQSSETILLSLNPALRSAKVDLAKRQLAALFQFTPVQTWRLLRSERVHQLTIVLAFSELAFIGGTGAWYAFRTYMDPPEDGAARSTKEAVSHMWEATKLAIAAKSDFGSEAQTAKDLKQVQMELEHLRAASSKQAKLIKNMDIEGLKNEVKSLQMALEAAGVKVESGTVKAATDAKVESGTVKAAGDEKVESGTVKKAAGDEKVESGTVKAAGDEK